MVFVHRKVERLADFVTRPGKYQLRDALRSPHSLQEFNGASDVLHHRITRRFKSQRRIRLRRHVDHYRVPRHVRGLDVLNALPKVAKAGMAHLPDEGGRHDWAPSRPGRSLGSREPIGPW